MIVVLQSAENQINSMINQFGTYKTKNEYGRSAFWIWHDIIRNEIKFVSIQNSKKVGDISYRFHMKYWGDILFDVIAIRNRGRYARNILVTGFNFDEENFNNWLQHQAPTEHREALPNVPDTRCKPKDIRLGFTKVKAKSGLWAIGDSSGVLISDDWFDDVSYMRKTKKGECAIIVNKGGWAYVYYPHRDKNHKFEYTNRTYHSMFCESIFNAAFKEALNELCTRKMLNESFEKDEWIILDDDDLKKFAWSVIKTGMRYAEENRCKI